jgi:WD40 repeat protein
METHEKPPAKQIVHAPSRGLAVRSAAIVARGLRDLTRNSNWLVQRVFTGRSPYLSISPAGQVCAISSWVQQDTERLAIYDIERDFDRDGDRKGTGLMVTVPGEQPSTRAGLPAVFAWSPTGRLLVTAWDAWPRELHTFDLRSKGFLGGFGKYSTFPSALAWSDDGKYFAAASSRGTHAALRLWTAGSDARENPFSGDAAKGVALSDLAALIGRPEAMSSPRSQSDEGPSDEVRAAGFGRLAFSSAGDVLATAVETEGEWADDAIVLMDVPAFAARRAFPVQGHVTDLSWTFDGRQLIFCSAGQAYSLTKGAADPVALPFGAELCACHPYLPLCLCFSSWLKNSAKGRIFMADLSQLTVLDEHAATGIVDLRWKLDGSKAYAVTADGLAYVYEPPLL